MKVSIGSSAIFKERVEKSTLEITQSYLTTRKRILHGVLSLQFLKNSLFTISNIINGMFIMLNAENPPIELIFKMNYST